MELIQQKENLEKQITLAKDALLAYCISKNSDDKFVAESVSDIKYLQNKEQAVTDSIRRKEDSNRSQIKL